MNIWKIAKAIFMFICTITVVTYFAYSASNVFIVATIIFLYFKAPKEAETKVELWLRRSFNTTLIIGELGIFIWMSPLKVVINTSIATALAASMWLVNRKWLSKKNKNEEAEDAA